MDSILNRFKYIEGYIKPRNAYNLFNKYKVGSSFISNVGRNEYVLHAGQEKHIYFLLTKKSKVGAKFKDSISIDTHVTTLKYFEDNFEPL